MAREIQARFICDATVEEYTKLSTPTLEAELIKAIKSQDWTYQYASEKQFKEGASAMSSLTGIIFAYAMLGKQEEAKLIWAKYAPKTQPFPEVTPTELSKFVAASKAEEERVSKVEDIKKRNAAASKVKVIKYPKGTIVEATQFYTGSKHDLYIKDFMPFNAPKGQMLFYIMSPVSDKVQKFGEEFHVVYAALPLRKDEEGWYFIDKDKTGKEFTCFIDETDITRKVVTSSGTTEIDGKTYAVKYK